MAKVVTENAEVNARILYWGIDGAGKRTSLESAATKLRPDNRGELVETPTRFDPSVVYTVLPIELGAIGGMRTRIELIAVPGGPSHAATRKQLLDQVDGIMLVIDAQADRIEENAAIVDELRKSLGDYARRLEDMPLVVQYNKRDLSDAYAIDELHRRLALGNATVFETVASESTGVLQALSTISKKVIRELREESLGNRPPIVPDPTPPPEPAAPAPPPLAPPSPAAEMEEAILAEAEADAEADPDAHAEVASAQSLLEQPWQQEELLEAPLGPRLGPGLSIVSVGEATRAGDRTVRVPLVLGDADGEISTLVLSISLDPLMDETS